MSVETEKGSERRRFDRFPARFPAKIKDSRDDYGVVLALRNASAQGLKITTKERLFINDCLTLEVRLPDSNVPLVLKGQVMWVKSLDAHLWEVGIRFHRIHLMNVARLFKYVAPADSYI